MFSHSYYAEPVVRLECKENGLMEEVTFSTIEGWPNCTAVPTVAITRKFLKYLIKEESFFKHQETTLLPRYMPKGYYEQNSFVLVLLSFHHIH